MSGLAICPDCGMHMPPADYDDHMNREHRPPRIVMDDTHLRAVDALRARFGWHGDVDDQVVATIRAALGVSA